MTAQVDTHAERLIAAIAHALYDTFHTARLSEHPEDFAEYERHAANFAHWAGIHGFRLVASAGEAGTAETVQQGSVHEHATPKGDAHD